MIIKDLINYKSLSDLIKEAGQKQRNYKSEAQFQFELAWAIKQLLTSSHCENDPEVYLEYLGAYRDSRNGKIKKIFTDILLLDSKGNFIPIELKYKTISNNTGDYFNDYGTHGATDYGRFDFLWDLKRIQYLKEQKAPGFKFDKALRFFCGGYAILLTNDDHYWKTKRTDKRSKDSLYMKFCIGDGETIYRGEKLEWKCGGKGSAVDGTWRNDYDYVVPLEFSKDINISWQAYHQNCDDFKFVIVDI